MKRDRGKAVVDVVADESVEVHEQELREPARQPNNLRRVREALLMSKAELARTAGLSPLTIDRVEAGLSCRVDTKRKIILALGLKLADKDQVFGKPEE